MTTAGFGILGHEMDGVHMRYSQSIQLLQVLFDVWFGENSGDSKDCLIRISEASTTNHGKNEIGKVEFN